jgi:hypothetical protein
VTVGGAIGLHAVFLKYVSGASLTPRLPRLVLVAVLVLFGVQLVMFGFLAEMLTKQHYADRKPYRIGEVVE